MTKITTEWDADAPFAMEAMEIIEIEGETFYLSPAPLPQSR